METTKKRVPTIHAQVKAVEAMYEDADFEAAHAYEDDLLEKVIRRAARRGDPDAKTVLRILDMRNRTRWYA